MVAKGVAASTLVRSLRRFAVPESVADAVASANGSISTHGLVLGTENDPGAAENEVAIWGVVRDLDKSASVLPYVPTGISVLGSFSAWVRGDGGHDDEDAEREAAATIAKEGLSAAKNLSPRVALVYVHETQRLHLFDYDAKPLPLEIIGCLHASDFVQATGHALLRASVSFEASSKQEVATFLERSVPYFVFPQRRQSIFNAEGVEVTRSESTSTSKDLRDLVKVPEKRVVASKSKKKKATSGNDNWDSSAKASNAISGGDFLAVDPVAGIESGYIKTLEYGEVADVQVLRNLGASSSLAGIAPVLEIRAPGQNVQVQPVRVTADALVVAPISAPVAKIVANLRDELAKQVSRLTAEWKSSIAMLRTDHFALLGASFPLSLPTVDRELSAAVATSKVLSEQFVQPENQPLFVPNKCSLSVQAASLAEIDVLFNVHEGIPPSGIPNGTQYLVDGFYGYYHYMQQAMNDKGWGCAYRSLQTLASWLFWNHYTATPTLSHRKIQETLVAIGDKPSTFVGSREWIGSMEVGFVLDELFGISFRTINANNGQQLVEKAQELKHHFETQGTPVMMGGGQLAFTLLGIDYNASSGECAFLILDPHYVGPEDLETIQTKTMPLEGYKAVPCGWRKASTFSKTSFYNLCLPQRPHME